MDDPRDEIRLEYLRDWRALARTRMEHIIGLTNQIFRHLVLLNGGAIVSLFTLLGHDAQLRVDRANLMQAFIAFVAGLVATMGGMTASFFAQNRLFAIEHATAEQFAADLMEIEVNAGFKIPGLSFGRVCRTVAIALSFTALAGFGVGCYLALLSVTAGK